MGEELFEKASGVLRDVYGPDATFRDGQFEAIEATVTRKRTLVVQKTGWGKSLVYFVATRLLRDQGRGLTLIVSPLLALMENQSEAAARMGLRCAMLNSVTRKDRLQILSDMEAGRLDVVFVTPETLYADEVQGWLPHIRIGLFVIDEAHCISDWGHDFRLEYARLSRVIQQFGDVPVLGTTATATQRVIEDLSEQMGGEPFVSVGPLNRDNLHLQVIRAGDPAHKYAWIRDNIWRIPGPGIIYCSTKRDCSILAQFLCDEGIPAVSYFSGSRQSDEERNQENLKRFERNEVKAIVASTKLGMGYDKDDVGFVIHYQLPSNIISYYQQIGRAGRKLADAYAFLLYGDETDLRIQEHFINSAFPSEREMRAVLDVVMSSPRGFVQLSEFYSGLNMRKGRIDLALKFLVMQGFVSKENGRPVRYYPTVKRFTYDREHYEQLTACRRRELAQMVELAESDGCLSAYVLSALDPAGTGAFEPCGHCANCLGHDVIELDNSFSSLPAAERYIASRVLPIELPKMWRANGLLPKGGRISPKGRERLEEGWCLASYGWGPYGEMVWQDKHPQPGMSERFCDELLDRSVEVLAPLVWEKRIGGIACVPSLRSSIVLDFTLRLSARLGIPFLDVLGKCDAPRQKEMENATLRSQNALASFYFKGDPRTLPDSVLLVDDIVDSKWTLTVCAALLAGQMPASLGAVAQGGCRHVYPFVLANSSNQQ